MSEAVEIIEQYRAMAVNATARAEKAEATIVALLACHQDVGGSYTIPTKVLESSVELGVRPKALKKGLKLTLIERETNE